MSVVIAIGIIVVVLLVLANVFYKHAASTVNHLRLYWHAPTVEAMLRSVPIHSLEVKTATKDDLSWYPFSGDSWRDEVWVECKGGQALRLRTYSAERDMGRLMTIREQLTFLLTGNRKVNCLVWLSTLGEYARVTVYKKPVEGWDALK